MSVMDTKVSTGIPYGQQSINAVIEARAQATPGRAFAHVLTTLEPLNVRTVTFSDLSNAVSQAAWLIASGLSSQTLPQQTLWYSGPSDLRYLVFALAASRTGHNTLLISPRNTSEAHHRLLRSTTCRHVFTPDPSQMLLDVAEACELQVHTFPSCDEVLWPAVQTPYRPEAAFAEIADHPFLILHTSASTNHPKPIVWTHRAVAVADRFHLLPEIDGERPLALEHNRGLKLFLGYPLFHAAGWNALAYCVYFETVPVFQPAGVPLSAAMLARVVYASVADCAAVPPVIVEEVVQDPLLLEELSQFKYIAMGGAPLSEKTGNAVSQRTLIFDQLGATETGCYPELRSHKRAEDWQYHHYHPSLGFEFRHYVEDKYEAVIARSAVCEPFQVAFVTFPESQEYATNDLYSKHPTVPGLWRYRGRKDNTIVLSNGEKFQADEVEHILSQHPLIDTALLVGESRPQSAMFLVAAASANSAALNESSKLEEIVNLANRHLPAHARLDTQHVRILDKDVTLPRSLKGKVQRKLAIERLDTNIDDLYRQADSPTAASSTPINPALDDRERLQKCISDHLAHMSSSLAALSAQDDFFSAGMDSLGVTRLRRALNADVANTSPAKQVTDRMIYEHPTAHALAMALRSVEGSSNTATPRHDESQEVQAIIEQMQEMLPKCAVVVQRPTAKTLTVMLTGSTGSLGSQLLHMLMQNETIGSIHCLNRSVDSESRQVELHARRGLRFDFGKRNVKFHTADLSKDDLGLAHSDSTTYDQLLKTVDCVLHIAWSVNWRAPFSSFRPQLLGCCNLASFSAKSPRRPRIIFASSVGVANGASQNLSVIREGPIDGLMSSEATGYSRSKIAAERILERASASPLFVPVTICRIGQIAGSTDGSGWTNSKEWLPSILTASSSMGILPDSLGSLDNVDWIPVDILAECLGGLAAETTKDTSSSLAATTYLHLVNRDQTSWSQKLCRPLAAAMDNVKVVPLAHWVETLQARAKSDGDMELSSAGSLVDFYKEISTRESRSPTFETTMTREKCPALSETSAIQPQWLNSWMRGWVSPPVTSSASTLLGAEGSDRGASVAKPRPNALVVKQPKVKVHQGHSGRKSLSQKFCSLAWKVIGKFEPPNAKIDRLRFQPVSSAALRLALDAGWLEKLRLDRALSAASIIAAGQSIELLVRAFRILSADDIILEVGVRQWKANKRTLLVCDEGIRAGLAHWFDNMAPVFVTMPKYFSQNGYAEPPNQEDGPYAAIFEGQTYWQRLSSEPSLYADLNTYMQSHKLGGCSLAALVPPERLTQGFDKSISDSLLVDMGGGKGHHLVELAVKYPRLPGRLILQDLAEGLPSTTAERALMTEHKIEMVHHNFFERQPVKGSRYYYLSAIFHDWPDASCRTILEGLADAMVPGYSRLLVNGIIIPDSGTAYFQAAKDWGMMAAMSGKERTLKETQELVACVPGLVVTNVWHGPPGRDSIIECELRG